MSRSHQPPTGGEIFITTEPLQSEDVLAWNQKGKQRIMGNGDNAEQITACQ